LLARFGLSNSTARGIGQPDSTGNTDGPKAKPTVAVIVKSLPIRPWQIVQNRSHSLWEEILNVKGALRHPN
jgi:hypothetical protein